MVSDPYNSATAESRPTGDTPKEADSAVANFQELRQRLEEVGRYLGHYLGVKRDRILRKVQRSLVLAAGIAIATVVVLAFLATAGVMLCVGIALAISRATGSVWMGPLFTGLAVLLALAGGTIWGMYYLDRMSLKRFASKSQLRRAELRMRYGRGIDE